MNCSEKIPLIVVCGATASGKTELGVRLAEIFNGEVVSADSMQIYREMADIESEEDKMRVTDELCDRFGDIRRGELCLNFIH